MQHGMIDTDVVNWIPQGTLDQVRYSTCREFRDYAWVDQLHQGAE